MAGYGGNGGFGSISWNEPGWSDWFNPGRRDAYPEARMSSPSPTPGDSGNPWLGFGKELFKGLIPGLGAGLTAALADKAFPGEPQKLISTDPRTREGTEAEQMRLASARQLQGEIDKGLADPYYGSLPPEIRAQQESEIRRDARAAAAARGILETGRTAEEESKRLIDYRAKLAEQRLSALSSRFSQLGTMTGGFQGETQTAMAGQENPWAKIGGYAAGGVGRGMEKALDRWII